jgi:uncharacterized membrane protein (UPF0127 family)
VRLRVLGVAVTTVALIVAGCSSERPSSPATTSTTSTATTDPFASFGRATVVFTAASGALTPGCFLVADTDALRARGLMEVIDLAGYRGMVFHWAQPVTESFWMRNTRLALSIAFFDRAGRLVSAADMEPCPDSVADCPLTDATGPYTDAIEVPQGALGDLSGSTMSVGGPCTPG